MYNENYVYVINSKKILFPKKRSSISWLLIANWVCFPEVRIWRGRVGWSEQRTGGCEGPGCLRGKQKDKLPAWCRVFPRTSPGGLGRSQKEEPTRWAGEESMLPMPPLPLGSQASSANGQSEGVGETRSIWPSKWQLPSETASRELLWSGCSSAPDSASYLLAISPAAMSAAHQESWKVKPGHLKVSDRGFAKEETELQQR